MSVTDDRMNFPAPRVSSVWDATLPLPPAAGPGLRATGWGGSQSVALRQQDMVVERRAAPEAAPAPAVTHPFMVMKTSTANVFKVLGGTCEGQLIPTQLINVGGTRPVAILAYPQYDLTVEGGQYVNVIAVRTGAYGPVLVSSSTQFSDIDSGISAGTEARAVVAYITEEEAVVQIAMGNIAGTFNDDGSLTGVAAGFYNKNL